jgi:hypothetical protein
MKEIIEQFITKLNKDGILSEEHIQDFEAFGSEIKTKIEEGLASAKEEALSEAKKEAELKISESEAHHEEELRKIEETFDSVVEKMDALRKEEIKLALCNYRMNESLLFEEEKVVEGIDKYLTAVVEDHLPEQPVVDYAKLERLENTFESVKNQLLISDDDVQAKVNSVLEDVQEELAQKSELLNDSIKRNIEYKSELQRIKASETLSEKVSDLPEFERKKIEKVFAESTSEEINEAFETELAKIKEEYTEEEIDNSKVVVEEKVEEEATSDLDYYAEMAERFLPKK